MKKSFFAFAALAAILAGCAKEVDTKTSETIVPGKEKVVILRASVPDADTKVITDNIGAFKWQAGDKVTVLNTEGTAFEFSTQEGGTEVDFGSSTFTGTLSTEAFYPASANHKSGKFYLEPSFTWVQDASMMPMLGVVDPSGPTASFKSCGGILKLICYNVADDARKLVVTSATKQITGQFTPSGDPKVIASADKSENNNILTINFAAGHASNMVFYIPLPTGDVGVLTFALKDGTDATLFEKATKAAVTMARNKMIVAPALNCSPVLWAEDWGTFVKDAVPSSGSGTGYGGATVTYIEADGGSTTKIYTEDLAGGSSPELLVGKTSGSFTASGIPTDGASSMLLSFRHKSTVGISLSSGITASKTSFTSDGLETVTLTNTGGVSTFNITFSATTGSNVRLDDISISKGYAAPIINTSVNTLTIGVGYLSNTLTVNLANAIDELGVSAVLSGTDYSWVESIVISGSTLTATAASANGTASERTATITLKATGAASKEITLKQSSALVAKPTVSAVPGNKLFTASWDKASHATGYKAYLNSSSGLADPTVGGTELTPVLDGSTYSVTKDGLTNGTTYYLYVKVNSVDDGYIADNTYTEVSVTPENVIYYEKVTSNLANWAGDYLVVWGTNAHYAVTANGLTTTAAVEIAGNRIVATGHSSHRVTVEKVEDNYFIKLPSGKYVTNESGSNTLTETDSKSQAYTFSINGSGDAVITGAGNKILQKNGNYYRFYTSNDNYSKPMLFKLNDTRVEAGLEWRKNSVSTSTDNATILTGPDAMPEIALDNPNGLFVSFTSSDPTVATVASSSNSTSVSVGAVASLLKAGTTVITASFADGDATYRPANVSYTLTVTDGRDIVATPTFSDVTVTYPEVNALSEAKSITISCGTAGATIYYTTGSSDFDPASWTEGSSVPITGLTTVRAVAVKADHQNSAEGIVSYRIAGSASALPDPSGVAITVLNSTTFTGSWTNDTNAADYEWIVSTSSTYAGIVHNGSEKNVIIEGNRSSAEYSLSGSTCTVTKSDLTLSGKYYFYVKAKGDGISYSDSENSISKSGIVLSFALNTNPGGWPTGNSTTLTNYTYTLNATNYTFGLYNVKCNSGYLMCTKTAGLGLPAISGYKLSTVIANNSGSCSTSVKVGISSTAPTTFTSVTGGANQTWSTTSSTYTYNLTSTSANTVYYLYVTSANAQIVKLTLTYLE